MGNMERKESAVRGDRQGLQADEVHEADVGHGV